MAVGRVLVTPSKIYLVGPELEVSNRVVRHFKEYIDRFIRISFVDENFRLIMGDKLSDTIRERIQDILSNGMHFYHYIILLYSLFFGRVEDSREKI